jgi:hypothetical protein
MGVLSFPVGAEEYGWVDDYAPVEHRVRAEDFERVEDYLRAYLEDERFRSAYLPAYERWSDAATMLYSADSKDSVLIAGERARESIEEFVRAFAASHDGWASNGQSTGMPPDGVSAVIDSCRPGAGDARCEFLQSLFAYWLVLSDVVERQRHSGQALEKPLRWEDARRVVVLAALVMVEIDRSL